MWRIAVILLASVLSVVSSYTRADDSVTRSFSQSLSEKMSFQEMSIKNRLQKPVGDLYLESKNYLPELSNTLLPIGHVKILADNILVVNIDIKSHKIVPNLSIDTFSQNVTNLVDELFYGQNIGQGGVICLFDGNVSEYFYDVKKSKINENIQSPLRVKRVVVSAAHGLYYNYGEKIWRFQRPFVNKMIEDTTTPIYASSTATYLKSRSGVDPVFVRSTGSGIHAPSGQLWWKMAARYWLKHRLPSRPDIWNSHSQKNPSNPKREEDDDVNSRPLYANAISAAGLLSLHTNGSDKPVIGWKVRGFSVLYHPNRPFDKLLAQNMNCYMRELKTSSNKYKSFLQWPIRSATNKGEINLSNVPTVIVEPGYHSNASDAAALRDPEFRSIVAKAIEKGWRLANEQKPCAPFDIASIPRSTGSHNTPIPVTVNYKGYPQFPLKIEVAIFHCPSGWTCNGGVVNIPDKRPSPVSYTFRCNASASKPAATFGLETKMTDADNVVTRRVRHLVVCRPTSNIAANSVSVGTTAGQASIE